MIEGGNSTEHFHQMVSGIVKNYNSKQTPYGIHTPSRTTYSVTGGATVDVNIGSSNWITLIGSWL